MLDQVFPFLINVISKCANWIFTLTINNNPHITLGQFLVACAFIGIVLYFIFGTDFFPGHITFNGVKSVRSNDNYQPRHETGYAGKDFNTRESRHKY